MWQVGVAWECVQVETFIFPLIQKASNKVKVW